MTGLKTGTWVLVADGQKALFLENVGDEQAMHLKVVRKEKQDNPATSEQGTDRPGRMNDGPSVHRSALSDADWHQLQKERFAQDLADLLYERAHANRFDTIVLVAAPEILGALRSNLHKAVRDRVIGEIAKTLTPQPLDEIERRLSAELG
ncbi:host attachment family protein [Defluviimonas sp. WL0002]|uniref:Host attachment family protein n=1 Tax=Albidovulum marisflavi TaxID=2984159 RepID=A0ABT2ZD81_9RHOB|nr:host attachment family protein [Defluviimonas sp. WL0002]MCV2869100.1 host attachment family protein [Defluviimonas sp. WL0002]